MSDIRYSDGDFYHNNAKRDIPNTNDHVIQNLAHRLDTTIGEHFYWTEYGTTIKQNPGNPNSPETHIKILNEIISALIQDTRIPDNSTWIQLHSNSDNVEAVVRVFDSELTTTIGDTP